MPSRPRCRSCKLAFTPDPRNRTKTKYRQQFCSEPPCQRESHVQASRRYRHEAPEDPAEVRKRVACHRSRTRPAKQRPPAVDGARGTVGARRSGPKGVAASEQVAMATVPRGRLAAVVASHIRRASRTIAMRVVSSICNVIAARGKSRSR